MIRCFLLIFFLAFSLQSFTGCATLPNAESLMEELPDSGAPPEIIGSKGELSPRKTETIIRRLERQAGPTDILSRHQAVMEALTGEPLIGGNKVTQIKNEKAIDAMADAIEHATDHINIETFIFDNDAVGKRIAGLLIKKQSQGVQVNLIYDGLGCIGTPPEFFQRMRDSGIRTLVFNPVDNIMALFRRDHRKIIVIDGKIAITGGVNFTAAYSSKLSESAGTEKGPKLPWRDTDIRIEGPAVEEYQKFFMDTWNREKGEKLPERTYFPPLQHEGKDLIQVIASTPGKLHRMNFLLYISALDSAEKYAYLTNGYFVPDHQTLAALKRAAQRGVDVEIIIPRETDNDFTVHAGRYDYSELLKAGVKLFEFRGTVLHAKTAVIDSVWSTVGSANLDLWSSLRNDEINAAVLSPEFAGEMEKTFADDLKKSVEITPEKWEKRPLLPRLKEWFDHLFVRFL